MKASVKGNPAPSPKKAATKKEIIWNYEQGIKYLK